MKAIFMGTPDIAVPVLEKMLQSGIDVPLVVCQPDKPKGRGKKLLPPPVKEAALKYGLEVSQPEKIKNNREFYERLKSLEPDFLVVVAYGKILPKDILDIPVKAPINVHFSLLPKYRGAAPVNWAIINGEEKTGVTTMWMDEGLDTGDILLKVETEIDRKDSLSLLRELSLIGADLLVETIKSFDSIKPVKQREEDASYAPILKKEDGLINFNEEASVVERRIRGLQPWPTAYTHLNGKLVKFFDAEVVDIDNEFQPGTVFDVTKKDFKIKCGKGALSIKELQFEGKKRMPTASFLAGFRLEEGDRFI